MELKEYYKIWKANISVVAYVVLAALVIMYAWTLKQSESYSASLLLEIRRPESQPTAEYKYDQFYRLQADEKFAETVSQWLKSPGVAKEIFEKSGIDAKSKSLRSLQRSFRAEKISSETVDIRYSIQSEDEAKKISSAIADVISGKIRSQNISAKDPNWFTVDPSNFVVIKNVQDLRINLAVAIAAGVFLGSFFAFAKHYLSE